jgi:hypothetical protein
MNGVSLVTRETGGLSHEGVRKIESGLKTGAKCVQYDRVTPDGVRASLLRSAARQPSVVRGAT